MHYTNAVFFLKTKTRSQLNCCKKALHLTEINNKSNDVTDQKTHLVLPSGRGVLQLIKLHALLNLLHVPLIVGDLVILAAPLEEMPSLFCGCLEWVITFMWTTSSSRGLAIGLCR